MNTKERPNRISYQKQADGSVDITIPAGMYAEFKKLFMKATNCAPDVSVEMRDFTDRFLEIDHFVGACMKQELFGYPKYKKPIERQLSKVICDGHPETCNCAFHAR